MTGKPKQPSDVDGRGDARGTPGLTALDEEREASMADEGGASGMAMESEGPAMEFEDYEPGLGFDLAVVGGVFVVGVLTGWLLSRLGRD